MKSSISHSLKAILLAARPGEEDGVTFFKVLGPLGQRLVIDYVIDLVKHFVSPKNVYVVVGYQREQVQSHLGDAYTYVVQDQLLGTGHAVLQVCSHLESYQGDLLILYGDTPLFRPNSILGMLNRHRLKGADLTLFTSVSNQPLPYGRIIRELSGQIVGIIEDTEASEQVLSIRELNVGAYVARAEALFRALQQLAQGKEGMRLPLTEVVHQMIRSGCRVTSYSSYDPDEILGINTAADLEQAEFVLSKRYLRPARTEEESEIHFGTGGWRAIIGEGFTMRNVRRLSQALANRLTRLGQEKQGVLVGYDRRFLSDRAAEVAAEVFAGNNIAVTLLSEAAPTPLITFATVEQRAALGLAFTASHNPPEWNGLKVFRQDGSLLMTEETNQIEAEANALIPGDIVKIELDLAIQQGIVTSKDFTNAYVDALESFVDMAAIRKAGLKVAIDPMHGVGQLTLDIILTEARCRVTSIHGRHDPLFGGRSPSPDLKALGLLINTIKEDGFDIGMATDGDADRIAIVDERGEYIHINDVLLLLYYYMHEVRNWRGAVVRNLATTHLLDRLAAHYNEKAIETPVGFKHITAAMQKYDALLGGESSGGLTIRGHILGKDGILAAALMVEMLALTRHRIHELLDQVHAITGQLYSFEKNTPATSEMKILIPKRFRETQIEKVGPYPVLKISHQDGTKLLLGNDNWLLLRFSGTEPVFRIFAEADTLEKAQQLVEWGMGKINE
ncbi:MAG: NTP transferase domain-containing protein [Anaerolineales bacterium]|jgi:phosphomannomutase/CTP:molybdopterin cytidylyltransferase MocA